MGISIKNKKKPKTAKVLSALVTYMFEEDFGELRSATEEQKQVLKDAIKVLGELK